MEFWPYNMAAGAGDKKPSTREQLLMTMVHPGLHEELTPRNYVVDLKKNIVVVQFQLQFTDEPSGKKWPPKQASAHYTIALDKNKDLKIKKIEYFVEYRSPEETGNLRELWAQYKEKALKAQKKQ